MSEQQAPIAQKKQHNLTIHGHTRADNYYWLRSDDRSNPEVLDYLQQENAFTQEKTKHTLGLQKSLYEEMVARLEPKDESVPYFKKGYWHVSRFDEGQDFQVYTRHKEKLDAPEELLLDCNDRAAGHEFYQLGALSLTPDQQTLAFSEDLLGRRQYDLRIKDLRTGKLAPEVIKDTDSIAWANDNKTLFYVKKHPETLLPYQVYRHELGTDSSKDVLVYEEQDDTFYTSIYRSRSENYLIISISSTLTSEALILDANTPKGQFEVFQPRERKHEYHIDHFNDTFYIRSNKTGKNFALMTANQEQTGDTGLWQTLIPARNDVLLEGFEMMQDWLIVEERCQGLIKLRQIHWTSGEEKAFEFDDPTYTAWLGYNPEPSSEGIRFGYTSLTTPSTTYELNLSTGERQILKRQKVLGEFKPENYQSERIWVTARDGVEVPVSLVYQKDRLTSESPLLIYAYGSYGSSMDPYFSSANLSLLERGFVYAIAHIRGGEELGRSWYEDGKLLHKQNTFNDYVDVTQGLVSKGFGDKNKVFALGGSAGGLLMGAIINMAPSLYRGVVAAVPFVDVVTTMLDESIPLTTGEYDEWGDPNKKTYYDYMLSYSPYDQVTAQDYPNLLVTTGLHDSQVQYWEPAKWVAKLRELKTNDNMLLLHTDMEAGHGGKSGRFKHLEDTAREFAFMLDLAGVTK